MAFGAGEGHCAKFDVCVLGFECVEGMVQSSLCLLQLESSLTDLSSACPQQQPSAPHAFLSCERRFWQRLLPTAALDKVYIRGSGKRTDGRPSSRTVSGL